MSLSRWKDQLKDFPALSLEKVGRAGRASARGSCPHRSATASRAEPSALVQRYGGEFRVPPILLVGPPAAGKTWWAEQIAEAPGVRCEFIALPSVSASFERSGGCPQWYTAMPGRGRIRRCQRTSIRLWSRSSSITSKTLARCCVYLTTDSAQPRVAPVPYDRSPPTLVAQQYVPALPRAHFLTDQRDSNLWKRRRT